MDLINKLMKEFDLSQSQVEKTVKLIDEGNTIPFISRYRKEITGGMSDVVLRELNDRLEYLRNLEKRKEEVINSIREQGKLTEELKQKILRAEKLQKVEDIYKPFKQKKATRASKAREKGLEPLAIKILLQDKKEKDIDLCLEKFVSEEKGVETREDALNGALDIIAEMISEDDIIIEEIRNFVFKRGEIVTEAMDKSKESPFEMYYDKKEKILNIPNHRILAINRGEKEKFLRVKLVADDELVEEYLRKRILKEKGIFTVPITKAIKDSCKRLIFPSVERYLRNQLKERAEEESIKVFGQNTEKLLMQAPVRGKRILSIDPGYRTGCKVAILDENGKLLDYSTIYPTKPKEDILGSEKTLLKYIEKYKLDIVVIGNGTASRETEEFVSKLIEKNNLDIQYTIVNEAGASVYSASKLASEEYPELDVTTRGAMSLGRRLQDPLAELVKIEPKHIGVGQYQHDMNKAKLDASLDGVVESCVNKVGVDLNTASYSLLSYISGINKTIAKNIVKYREEKGAFDSRKELLKVSKLGPKAYEQCAGFLRIYEGKEILDETSVHPESYEKTKALMKKLNIKKEDIGSIKNKDIDAKISEIYGKKDAYKLLSEELEIGIPTLKDIIEELKKPVRDPRGDSIEVIFRKDTKSIDDLKIGMEMLGTVRNVVDFGAFVDIGIKNDGLVHISQLSEKFVKCPIDVVSIGDTVKVKVIDIDRKKGKVGLTMRL